jgi:hypothetical protein
MWQICEARTGARYRTESRASIENNPRPQIVQRRFKSEPSLKEVSMIGCKQFCTAMLREAKRVGERNLTYPDRMAGMYAEGGNKYAGGRYFWVKDKAGSLSGKARHAVPMPPKKKQSNA